MVYHAILPTNSWESVAEVKDFLHNKCTKITWYNRGAPLYPLSGHVLAKSNLYVQIQCPGFLSKVL